MGTTKEHTRLTRGVVAWGVITVLVFLSYPVLIIALAMIRRLDVILMAMVALVAVHAHLLSLWLNYRTQPSAALRTSTKE